MYIYHKDDKPQNCNTRHQSIYVVFKMTHHGWFKYILAFSNVDFQACIEDYSQ